MAHSIAEEIAEAVNNLPVELQKKVLDYALGLRSNSNEGIERKPVPGVPGKELLRLAGTISQEDAEAMLKAIEEECERVDLSEW